LQRIQIKQSKMSQEHLTKLDEELYFAFHGNTILILILFLFILNLISFFHVNSFFSIWNILTIYNSVFWNFSKSCHYYTKLKMV
jgi:hypothetical protein